MSQYQDHRFLNICAQKCSEHQKKANTTASTIFMMNKPPKTLNGTLCLTSSKKNNEKHLKISDFV